MAFDITTARPVSSTGINLPADPLKRKSDLVELQLKYLQAQQAIEDLKKSQKPPVTYGQVAAGEAAKTEGRKVGEYRAAARQKLPGAVRSAKATTGLIQKFLAHPGFSAVVGMPEPFKGGFGVYNVRGTRAKDAESLYKQIGDTSFVAGVEALKGTGPISEKEGEAAKAAIQRMSSALSEAEFKQAAQEYVDAMERGIAAMRDVAAMPAATPVVVPSSGEKD